MNNAKVKISDLRKAIDIIQIISNDPDHIHIGLTESKMGIELCCTDRQGKLHTLVFGGSGSYHKTELWNVL